MSALNKFELTTEERIQEEKRLSQLFSDVESWRWGMKKNPGSLGIQAVRIPLKPT